MLPATSASALYRNFSLAELTQPIVRLGFFILHFAALFIVSSQARDDLCECRCVYVDGISEIQLLTTLDI